jgi:acetylornithine deacetylase/succinyl-diaminopimelate desuccinylase-like protein
MSSLSRVQSHINANRARHIALIRDFVRRPSISLDQREMASGAAQLASVLKEAGCRDAATIELGDGFPGVWGSIDCGRPATILIYSHYDVRPVGTEPWTHEPFSGDVVAFGGFSEAIVGRGAAAKAPLMAFICAVQSMLAAEGTLPVNLKFLIEGAEIKGSPNYTKLFEARKHQLGDVSALYGPRSGQDSSGRIGFSLGYKGLVYFDVVADAAAWGRGPKGGAVHSSSNVVVDNPAWRLVRALATLTDSETGDIAIPGLLDAVAKPKAIEAWEAPLVDEFAKRLTANDPNGVIPGLSPQFPVLRFKEDLKGEALARRYLYGPAMNISSLRSGYTGPGTKSFLLPDVARATVDLRAISSVTATDLVRIIRKHLDDAGYPDVRLEVNAAYDWYQTPLDDDFVRAATDTLGQHGYAYQAWPIQAFGGPWAHFGKVLGVPSLQGGAPGHGARAATSDEFFVLAGTDKIAGLVELENYYVDFLRNCAKALGTKRWIK